MFSDSIFSQLKIEKSHWWCKNTILMKQIIENFIQKNLTKQQEDYFFSIYVSKVNDCYKCSVAFNTLLTEMKINFKTQNISEDLNRLVYYNLLLTLIYYDLPSPPTLYAIRDFAGHFDLLLNTPMLEALECNIEKNVEVIRDLDIPKSVVYILSACTMPYTKHFARSFPIFSAAPPEDVSTAWTTIIHNPTLTEYINCSSIWQALLYSYSKQVQPTQLFLRLCVDVFIVMSKEMERTPSQNTDFLLFLTFDFQCGCLFVSSLKDNQLLELFTRLLSIYTTPISIQNYQIISHYLYSILTDTKHQLLSPDILEMMGLMLTPIIKSCGAKGVDSKLIFNIAIQLIKHILSSSTVNVAFLAAQTIQKELLSLIDEPTSVVSYLLTDQGLFQLNEIVNKGLKSFVDYCQTSKYESDVEKNCVINSTKFYEAIMSFEHTATESFLTYTSSMISLVFSSPSLSIYQQLTDFKYFNQIIKYFCQYFTKYRLPQSYYENQQIQSCLLLLTFRQEFEFNMFTNTDVKISPLPFLLSLSSYCKPHQNYLTKDNYLVVLAVLSNAASALNFSDPKVLDSLSDNPLNIVWEFILKYVMYHISQTQSHSDSVISDEFTVCLHAIYKWMPLYCCYGHNPTNPNVIFTQLAQFQTLFNQSNKTKTVWQYIITIAQSLVQQKNMSNYFKEFPHGPITPLQTPLKPPQDKTDLNKTCNAIPLASPYSMSKSETRLTPQFSFQKLPAPTDTNSSSVPPTRSSVPSDITSVAQSPNIQNSTVRVPTQETSLLISNVTKEIQSVTPPKPVVEPIQSKQKTTVISDDNSHTSQPNSRFANAFSVLQGAVSKPILQPTEQVSERVIEGISHETSETIIFDDLSIKIKIRVLGMKRMIMGDANLSSELDSIKQKYGISQIPQKFDNSPQYIEIFSALLNVEFKENLKRQYNSKHPLNFKAKFINFCKCEPEAELYFLFFQVDDYVHFSRDLKRNELILVESEDGKTQLFSLYINGLKSDNSIPLLIYCLTPPSMFSSSANYRLRRLDNITTYLREKQALDLCTTIPEIQFLLNASLDLKYILNPIMMRALEIFGNSDYCRKVYETYQNDSSQIYAIRSGASLISFDTPHVCLIKGPPGTGKTKTIIGIIQTALNGIQYSRYCQKCHNKILVCAPSNLAIDEILLRISQDGLLSSNGITRIHPLMIRLGNSADERVESFDIYRQILNQHPDYSVSYQNEYHILCELRNKRNSLQLQMESGELKETKEELITRIKSIKSQIIYQDNKLNTFISNAQPMIKTSDIDSIFSSAPLIFSTLSSSFYGPLQEYTKKNPLDLIIMDECSQSVEPSSLIPLLCKHNGLVLVGDEQQLPPTVTSQKCKEFNYSQSLFERIVKNISKESILFLNTQYRMHLELSAYICNTFYPDLKNSELVKTCRSRIHKYFPTLLFCDVNGEENQDSGTSYENDREAKFIVNILSDLLDHNADEKDIGVITPYKAQVKLITHKLLDKHLKSIEVKTVDGFQGREKGIIILSCVRTSNVGFVNDVNRLIVSLTRAKHILIIVGNKSALQNYSIWNNYIKFLEKTNSIRTIRDVYEKISYSNDERQKRKENPISDNNPNKKMLK